MTRQELIDCCLELPAVYEDYPFGEGWLVVRHRSNSKSFAMIFESGDYTWVNLKCEPNQAEFWRSVYASVVPAYHMNKRHWNSVILDGTIPPDVIRDMVSDSYDLIKPKVRKRTKNAK
jgi:predicted DNA-binding protein (MmcQ/YjbR family)